MPAYDRGDPPRDQQGILSFLWQELNRLEAYAHAPQTDGAWEDLRFPAQAINIPGPAGAPTWDTTNIGHGFSSSAQNDLQMVVQFPHSWKEGTEVRPHIHWEPGTGFTVGQAAVWCLYVRWRNNGQTTTAQTAYTVTTTVSHTLALLITEFPALSGTGMDISSIMDLQLSRLSLATGDDMAATAILKEFDIHYQVDSLGSDKEYIK